MKTKIYESGLKLFAVLGLCIVGVLLHEVVVLAYQIGLAEVFPLLRVTLLILTLVIVASWLAFWRWVSIVIAVAAGVLAFFCSLANRECLVALVSYGVIVGLLLWERHRVGSRVSFQEIKAGELGEQYNALQSEFEKEIKIAQTFEKKGVKVSHLRDVVHYLSLTLDVDEIIERIVFSLKKMIDKGQRYSVQLISEDFTRLEPKVCLEGDRFKTAVGEEHQKRINKWILYNRKPLLVSNIQEDFRFHTTTFATIKYPCLMMCPLVTEDKVIGAIKIESQVPESFGLDDLRLLFIIANIASNMIRSSQLYAKTGELAKKDGLTGLFVPRYYRDRLAEHIADCRRKQGVFSLIMLDLDNFKSFNDTYGHTVGDMVLKTIAGILKKYEFGGNVIARYGGEEFSIIMPNKSKDHSVSMAEFIRHDVESAVIYVRRKVFKITVSGGISSYPEDGETQESLIHAADKALYHAKELGKNRVCCYESPPEKVGVVS